MPCEYTCVCMRVCVRGDTPRVTAPHAGRWHSPCPPAAQQHPAAPHLWPGGSFPLPPPHRGPGGLQAPQEPPASGQGGRQDAGGAAGAAGAVPLCLDAACSASPRGCGAWAAASDSPDGCGRAGARCSTALALRACLEGGELPSHPPLPRSSPGPRSQPACSLLHPPRGLGSAASASCKPRVPVSPPRAGMSGLRPQGWVQRLLRLCCALVLPLLCPCCASCSV